MRYIVIRSAASHDGLLSYEPGVPGDVEISVESVAGTRDAADLARDPRTLGMARSMPLKLIRPMSASDADDAAPVDTWGVEAVGAGASTMTGHGVKVAILDTGLMRDWRTHPAFKGRPIVGKSFVPDEPDHDDDGHGTHCAGTIFGGDVNGKRIGIARGITPLIGKVLGRGGGTSAGLLQAIQWAQQEGADIITMSLGFDFPGMVQEGIEQDGLPPDLAASVALEAYAANARSFDALLQMFEATAPNVQGRSRPLLIAAAGNESRIVKHDTIRIAPSLPSAARGVISVGAVERVDGALHVAEFSNGPPRISAPGVDIVSVNANTGGLKRMHGTSMACPHVAGVAALWWEQEAARPGADATTLADTVAMLLLRTAKRTGLVSPQDAGAGLVQAP